MFFEIAIGIKAVVIIVSLIGLFLGLFPEFELFPAHKQVVEHSPDITNEWAALAYSSDAETRDDVLQAVKEHQITARQADDNTARVALYEAAQASIRIREKKVYSLLTWFVIGAFAALFPASHFPSIFGKVDMAKEGGTS